MPLATGLLAARLHTLHKHLRHASDPDAPLRHVAIRSDDPSLDSLLRHVGYSVGNYIGESQETAELRQLGHAILKATRLSGAGCGLQPTLTIDSESWHGDFISDWQSGNWIPTPGAYPYKQVDTFHRLTGALPSEFGLCSTGGSAWLEVLYRTAPIGKTRLCIPKGLALLRPGKFVEAVWLREDVFLASAKAIELLIATELNQGSGDDLPRLSTDTSKGLIVVDGRQYDMEPHHCRIVKALIDARGLYVTGPNMQKLKGCKGKKISREIGRIEKLIPALKKCILHGGNKGYRIRQ